MKHRISAQQLRELLDYDTLSGIFTWKVWRGGGSPAAGSAAGSVTSRGYRMIHVNRRQYPAHRLAWLYVHGEWPAGDIDHNWIDNLRPATRRQNNGNSRRRRDNTSGLKGANYHRRTGKWRATIKGTDGYIHLGLFLTAQEAHAAYVAAAQKMFGEFARAA